MKNRYILQSILINKDEAKLTDAISWLVNNHSEFTLNAIDENDKYFVIEQVELHRHYFPIMRETINEDLGIHLLYYSDSMFPIPKVKSRARD